MFWKKKRLSDDYVDLSIGRVYYAVLTNGILRKVEGMCTVGDVLNQKAFMSLIELYTLDIKKKTWSNLSVEDGQKVRSKTIEILQRYGIYNERTNDQFTDEEKEWFESRKVRVVKNG